MANEIIIAENFPQSNIAEETFLTADALAAQKVINVENTDGLLASYYLLIGMKGAESSQIDKIATGGISGLAVTCDDNLLSKHYRNEPVFVVKSNQIKIYRAANVDGSVPEDASFSLLTTKNIQADQLYTEYTDTNGGSGYWYKYTFYNSSTTDESPLSDAIPVRGGNYGLYASVDEVRDEAGLNDNPWITSQVIASKLSQAQSEVNGSLAIGGYTLPLETVPDLVKNATLMLAAGYVLTKDYGPEHTGTNKDGQLKIKMAKDILMKIEKGKASLIDNITGQAISQTAGVRSYPDDNTELDNEDLAPAFSMDMKL